MVKKENQVALVLVVCLEQKARKAIQEEMVHLVYRVIVVCLETLVLKVAEVMMDDQDCLASQDLLVRPDIQVILDLRDLKERQLLPFLSLDHLVHKETWDCPAWRVCQV